MEDIKAQIETLLYSQAVPNLQSSSQQSRVKGSGERNHLPIPLNNPTNSRLS